jgi:hypothetical protein
MQSPTDASPRRLLPADIDRRLRSQSQQQDATNIRQQTSINEPPKRYPQRMRSPPEHYGSWVSTISVHHPVRLKQFTAA